MNHDNTPDWIILGWLVVSFIAENFVLPWWRARRNRQVESEWHSVVWGDHR